MAGAASGAGLDPSGGFSPKGRFSVAQLMATQHHEPFLHPAPRVGSACPSSAVGAASTGAMEEVTEPERVVLRLRPACATGRVTVLCFDHQETLPLAQVSLCVTAVPVPGCPSGVQGLGVTVSHLVRWGWVRSWTTPRRGGTLYCWVPCPFPMA